MYCGDPDTKLETVVYLSTATHEMSPVALHELLARARENNRVNNITGVLLYAEGSFLQVLEGPADRVSQTLSRIECDPRHKGLMVFLRHEIKMRGFGEWSMGYRNACPDMASIFALTAKKLENFENGVLGDEVLTLLQQFYASSYPHVTT